MMSHDTSLRIGDRRRRVLLPSLVRHLAVPSAAETPLVHQQLETALALLDAPKLGAQTPDEAGHLFGAWLKIAIKQSPEFFVDEAQVVTKFDLIRTDWGEALNETRATVFLDNSLEAAKALFSFGSENAVRILFIGDCLLWDSSLQLQIEAMRHDIRVEPTVMAQRLGGDLRRELIKLKQNDFDLVVYSPFTYEFSGEYAFATAPGAIFRAPRKASRMLDEALADVEKTVQTLGAKLECPIYVHTVSGVRQSQPGWRGLLLRAASLPGRLWASRRVNAGLDDLIAGLNATRTDPVLRMNELPLGVTIPSADKRGLIAYNAGELHPTRLALELARGQHLCAARVAAQLSGKKLIVCDLDNTLWDGVIGEGAVKHHHDRQKTLLELKARGIVLAVASKNDPENVSWYGATLGETDFVAQKINWGPKAANILAMATQLNLNPASFIFLDDRPDERSMAVAAVSGLIALDPNDAETWAMLAHWAETSQKTALQDRTAMYRERAERDDFLNSIAVQSKDIAKAYSALDLRVSLRHPNKGEMARVVELINRTNQFNTTAARTTRSEMDTNPDARQILIAEVSDKYGNMGISGVLVMGLHETWRITHFVLSCRVFGFGIEDIMLNAVKRWGDGTNRIHATLIETPVNGPCRDVYERNGFIREGSLWIFEGKVSTHDPSWLSVDDETGEGVTVSNAADQGIK